MMLTNFVSFNHERGFVLGFFFFWHFQKYLGSSVFQDYAS